MSEDKEQEFYAEYDGLSLTELAKAQIELKDKIAGLKSESSLLQSRFDHLRKHRIPTVMEDMGIESVKLAGIGRLSLRGEIYAGMVDKDLAYAWLEENGHGDLIKPTVNASTLKAFLKEQMREGEVLPEDVFKSTPYMMATITKT